MQRRVVRVRRDEHGERIADLDCMHTQPLGRTRDLGRRARQEDPSPATGSAGDSGLISSPLECLRCDRAELPCGLTVVRTAGPFDETNVPAGLRRAHRVAEGVWGRLQVLEGSVGFRMEGVVPVLERQVLAGEGQPIPPGAVHELQLAGPVRLCVDFLRLP